MATRRTDTWVAAGSKEIAAPNVNCESVDDMQPMIRKARLSY